MKRGVVVSDIHCGSIYGILPAQFTTFDGIELAQVPGQVYLWECWNDFCRRVSDFNPDFCIVNADCVDGPQRKNQGSELCLRAPQDQADAAIQTLKILRGSMREEAKWYFTQGTPYHVGEFGAEEERIAVALNAAPYWSVGTGRYCREVLWLNVEGVIVEAAHHIAPSGGFYRMTSLDREAQWAAMSGKDSTKGVPKSRILIRSHVHYFGHVEHASKDIVTTPCWQLQTRFMRKNSIHRMHPDIGGVFIEIDGSTGQVRIEKEIYNLPPVQVTEL